MKRLTSIFLAGAFAAVFASAAPFIDLSLVGFSGTNAVGFNHGSTSIALNDDPFGLICLGPDAALCGGGAYFTSLSPLDSGVPETFSLGTGALGAGLAFTSNGSAWSVTENFIAAGDASFYLSGVSLLGTFSAAGYEDTPGVLTFSSQSSSSIEADQQVTWSAQGHSSPVPEPGSLALLGSGLVGLGFLARRRRS